MRKGDRIRVRQVNSVLPGYRGHKGTIINMWKDRPYCGLRRADIKLDSGEETYLDEDEFTILKKKTGRVALA